MERIRLTLKMLWFAVKSGRVGSPSKLQKLLKARKQLQSSPTTESVQVISEMLGMNEKVRRYKAHTEEARQGRNIEEILSEMMQESWEDSCRRLGTVIQMQLFLALVFSFAFIASPFYFGRDVNVLFFMWPAAIASLIFFSAAFYLVWKARPSAEVRDFTRDSLLAHQAGDVQAQQQILRDFQHKVQHRVGALKN